MVVTLFGGALWAIVYQRVPNLYAPASHALGSLMVTLTVSPQLGHGCELDSMFSKTNPGKSSSERKVKRDNLCAVSVEHAIICRPCN
jgi:hypothetical protein